DEIAGASANREKRDLSPLADPGRNVGEERHRELRHRRVLPESAHLEARQERDHRSLAMLKMRDGCRDRALLVDDIGVDEEQQLAVRVQRALMQRPRLAEPSIRLLVAMNDDEARIADRREDLR